MDAADAIYGELRQAAVRMTPRERALGDALVDLIGEAQDIAKMMGVIAECDSTLAPMLLPLIDQLRAAKQAGIATHAAVVAEVNGSTVQ